MPNTEITRTAGALYRVHRAALVAMLFVVAGCQPASPRPTQPGAGDAYGAERSLGLGAALGYPDGLRITLEKIDDSRCPADVQCVWAGELAPTLRLEGGDLSAAIRVTLGTVSNSAQAAGPYRLVLAGAEARAIRLAVTRSAPSP